MNSGLNISSFSWKDLPKLLLVILGVTIICFLFPSHEARNYEYGSGKNWQYHDLYAAKDFSVSIKISQGAGIDSLIDSTIRYKKGNLIIGNGQFVNVAMEQTLRQYFDSNNIASSMFTSSGILYFLGYFLLTALIIGALMLYALKYFPESCSSLRGVSFLIMWPVLFSILVYVINSREGLSPYLIPFCIVPIVVLNFYNGRLALIVHIVVVLIASFLSNSGYEFTFLQILAGIVTVLVVTETRFWNKFFVAILIILATYMIAYLGLAMINSGSVASDELNVFGWLSINALLLLLAYPFIPIIEGVFGYTSKISLAELSDMNKPLLRELSLKAPGTLQHSLQVANLCESAAEAIGANSLLVKTAALYHDIGKIKNAAYFIENSMGDNPHDKINNFESARIIIEHVTEGVVMAKKAKLPQILIEFIKTHHGTTKVEYFLRNQKNEEPDRNFDESLFEYPGPKPSSKEQTILMLADSIEASSKSLKNPTGVDIDQLIDNIIQFKISKNQLTNSDLSFSELQKCTDVFKSLLRSIYHVRVEYPAEKKAE